MEYWCINNSTAQWNRMKSPEIDPNIHENLVYDMVGGISDHWDKTYFFKWCLNNHIAILEKDKKRAYFTQYTEINSK